MITQVLVHTFNTRGKYQCSSSSSIPTRTRWCHWSSSIMIFVESGLVIHKFPSLCPFFVSLLKRFEIWLWTEQRLNYKNFSYFANTWNLFPVYTFYTHIWFVGKWFNWNWQLASYFRLQKKRRMIIICRWLWSLL